MALFYAILLPLAVLLVGLAVILGSRWLGVVGTIFAGALVLIEILRAAGS